MVVFGCFQLGIVTCAALACRGPLRAARGGLRPESSLLLQAGEPDGTVRVVVGRFQCTPVAAGGAAGRGTWRGIVRCGW